MGEMLTVKQLQTKLKISRKTAYDLCRVPGFPVCKIMGKILIPEEKLQRWISDGGTMKQQEMPASPERSA